MDSFILKSIKNALKHWYLLLIVGILFVVVSIVVFTSPTGSLLALAILFSLSFLFGGLSEVIFSLVNRHQLANWGWSLGFGIVTALVGLLLFLNPELSRATLVFYIGFIILFRSISAISFAVDVKRYGSKGWGGLLAMGILGAIVAFTLLWNPVFAGLSIVVLVALNFLFSGLFNIILSFQLKKLHTVAKQLPVELEERMLELEKEIRDEWDDYY
ncbi:MAG: DUF308 domain-containing protein [Balneolaceae bacterium]